MYVVATAGHVDHGKSTLVKALTGAEPDRWEEEKRRGLTIDLGFVWADLPSGAGVAFVDVPGHERFLANMLAGVGPAPAVMFIVAADEGWQEQSDDHRDAVDAFGITDCLIALTRADKATDEQLAATRAQVREKTAGTVLADAPVVAVSAVTGTGLDDLRTALDEVLSRAKRPDPDARLRFWIDRAFSITGAGTVVTGTLTDSTVRTGDTLALGEKQVSVRSLQSEERTLDHAAGNRRVALNLRGVAADEISRGDVVTTPGAWEEVALIDVRGDFTDPPREVAVHVGTAEVAASVRPLGKDHARLTLARPLPLTLGDRLVLRKPGDRSVYTPARVMDLDPPELSRRGDGQRRAEELAGMRPCGSIAHEVRRRKAMRREHLARFGLTGEPPKGVVAYADWYVAAAAVMDWRADLLGLLDSHLARHPVSAGLPRAAALTGLDLPGDDLFPLVIAAAKLESTDGHLHRPGHTVDLGPEIDALVEQLAADPFAAPEAHDLRPTTKQLAAAERAGRLLRLGDEIILHPSAVEEARRRLGELEQPFTTSAARRALGTTRRVAIPLLEHLDARGITHRVDATLRRLTGR